jgi:hypothetical protein
MNAKKAKLLRKSIGYHPKDERKYQKTNAGIILVECSRVQYLKLKEAI